MNQCIINIIGYVRLVHYKGQEHIILPYVAEDDKGVYVVNQYGNAIHVDFNTVEIL